VLARALGLAAAAVVLAALVLPWRPPTLCLLRALTGLPCPFCGSTTAMVELGRGAPLRALAASPLATLGAPLWVLWPLLQRKAACRWAPRTRLLALAGVLASAELWQLQRAFG
jgi:hypothetical protein